MNRTKLVKEFHANFTDPGTKNKYHITADTFESLQKDIKNILGSNAQLETANDKTSYTITHRDQAVGWISQYEVPETMSVRTLSNYVTLETKAA